MTSLSIHLDDIPSLDGKTALVTGGSSGIGLAAVEILLEKGAQVAILDIRPPPSELLSNPNAGYIETDISSWTSLVRAFAQITKTYATVDIAIANAGLPEDGTYLRRSLTPAPSSDAEWADLERDEGIEKMYRVVEINIKGTANFVMLAARVMKGQGERGGSIVLNTSATAYMPEHSIPIFCSTKGALTVFIRTLRSTLIHHHISISGVAPSATTSATLPPHLSAPIVAASLPVSTSRHVGLALVYSAVARQTARVENYGNEAPLSGDERWNGRVIMTLGETWTEVEEPLIELRPEWWGVESEGLSRRQQAVTDFRSSY